MRKILSIFCIFTFLLIITQSKQTNYLSIPFKTEYTTTHEAHNIQVEINQLIYRIDVTPQKKEDNIRQLSGADKYLSRSNTPDYRKYPQSIYGLIRSSAVQRVDKRLPRLKQIVRNSIFYLQNIEKKTVWTNQKNIKQIPWEQNDDRLFQGSFNIGPNKQRYVFDDILKYSPYMNNPIITWKLADNQKLGEIILGHYPLELLQNQDDYQIISINKVGYWENWMLDVHSIHLKSKLIKKQQTSASSNIQLSKVSIKMKVNLSQRKVKLPQYILESIAHQLQGCQRAISSSGGKPLVCKAEKLQYYKQFILVFQIKKHQYFIQLPLEHLIYQISGINFILNIEEATNEHYQISPAILKDYLLGIDYRKKLLYIGKKGQDSLLSLQLLVNIFIGINVIIFIFSLLVLSIASKFNKTKENYKQSSTQLSVSKLNIYEPQAGGYIIPMEQDHSPSQNERVENM